MAGELPESFGVRKKYVPAIEAPDNNKARRSMDDIIGSFRSSSIRDARLVEDSETCSSVCCLPVDFPPRCRAGSTKDLAGFENAKMVVTTNKSLDMLFVLYWRLCSDFVDNSGFEFGAQRSSCLVVGSFELIVY